MKKIILILSSLMLLSGCGVEVIGTGNRGILVKNGKVTGDPVTEGIYFHTPLISKYVEMNVREQKYAFQTQGYSKDAQLVGIEYAVNFKPDALQIHRIYEEVGFYWQEVLVKQILEGNIKEVTGRYTAIELIEKRQELIEKISEVLLSEFLKKRIHLISFEITNMDFDNEFERAVKNKVIAVEEAKEAQNRTVKVREEADQRIIAAKAEAESMRIRSNALSQNKSLVEYEAVQKWDGKMPQYMMGNSIPFVNLQGK